jgi:hypothetical protein
MPPKKAKAARSATKKRAAARRQQPSRSAKKRKVSSDDEDDMSLASDEALPDTPLADDNEAPPDGNEAPAGGASPPGQGKKSEGGINTSLQPISDVREMFEDMVERLNPTVIQKRPFQLNVATICSGTDAPIFALTLIQEALQAMGFGTGFEFRHLFSCEIEPFKQGFIRRNLPHGTLIFRDVVELASAVSTGEVSTARETTSKA